MNLVPFIIFATVAYLWLFYSLAILARREDINLKVFRDITLYSIAFNLLMYFSYHLV